MTTRYSVESFFINVGIGDGAIHLLIDNQSIPKIKSAVLIDGGEAEGKDRTIFVIKEMRKKIGEDFSFDAIVITHWDGDHYRGTMEMLWDDYCLGSLSKYVKSTATLYAPKTFCAAMEQENRFVMKDDSKGELCIYYQLNAKTKKMCRFIRGTDCIGYDIFSGRRLDAQRHRPMTNINSVYEWPGTSLKDPNDPTPMLLCVGCEAQFINSTTLVQRNDTWLKATTEKDKANASSVMLLCLWPRGKNSNQSRITLYTAGDAGETEENVLVEWLKGGHTVIDVIKPGHHGSAKSTPEGLLDFNTKYFVISAAEKHGHPSFALLLFLMAYVHSRQNLSQTSPKILATCYPYWMARTGAELSETDCNLRHVLDYKEGCYKLESSVFSLTRHGKHGGEYLSVWLEHAIPWMKRYYVLTSWCMGKTDLEVERFLRDADNAKMFNRQSVLRHAPVKAQIKYLKNSSALYMNTPRKLLDWTWSLAADEVIRALGENWDICGQPQNDPDSQVAVIHISTTQDGVFPRTLQINLQEVPQKRTIDFQFTNYRLVGRRMANLKKKSKGGNDVRADDKYNQTTVKKKMISKKKTDAKLLKLDQKEKKEQRKKKKLKDALSDNQSPRDTEMTKMELFALDAATGDAPELDEEPSQAQLWINSFFVDDLKQVSSLPRNFAQYHIPTSSCARWFSTLFDGADVVVKFDGTSNSGEVDIDCIMLEACYSTKKGLDSTPMLVFNSSKDARIQQFGLDATSPQTKLGFDARLESTMLALSSSTAFSLADFARILRFKLPLLDTLLQGVMLLPRISSESRVSRSGVWIIPGPTIRTCLRMEAIPDPSAESTKVLQDLLVSDLGSLTDIVIRGTSTQETLLSETTVEDPFDEDEKDTQVLGNMSEGEPRVKTTSTLSLDAAVSLGSQASSLFHGRVSIAFSDRGFELRLKMAKGTNVLEELFTWIMERFGHSTKDTPKLVTDHANKIRQLVDQTSGFSLQDVVLQFSEKVKLVSCTINGVVSLSCGVNGSQVPVVVSFAWNAAAVVLNGELCDPTVYPSFPKELDPFREDMEEIPVPEEGVAISIPMLLGLKDVKFPPGIPDLITGAKVSLIHTQEFNKIVVEGIIECSPPTAAETGSFPVIWFDDLRLYLEATLGNTGNGFVLSFRGGSRIESSPDHPSDTSVIDLDVAVLYKSTSTESKWSISANISNVRIANLYELLAQDGADDAIMDIMSQVVILHAGIDFEYTKGQPSRLAIDGCIMLGPLELDLTYVHDKSGWQFTAHLSARSTTGSKERNPTLGDILKNFIAKTESLPEFVQKLEIPVDKLRLDLSCSSTTAEGANGQPGNKYVVFSLRLTIGNFSVTFAQIIPYDGAITRERNPTAARILQFELTGTSESNIPVVGKVDLPLDRLGIVWANRDVSAEEIARINAHLLVFPLQRPILIERKAKKESNTGALNPFVRGTHFQVVMLEAGQPRLVLDHVVAKKSSSTSSIPGEIRDGSAGDLVYTKLNDEEANQSPEKTVKPMAKTFGPLTIRNVGLSVSGPTYSTVSISLDATVNLGPVGITLLSLSLAVDLASITKLEHLTRLPFEVSIRGMDVEFSKPPTRLAGTFVAFGTRSDPETGFMGAIAVSVAAWSAIAAGMYSESTGQDRTRMLFVFGVLRGPIFSLGSFEVNGLTGGFGYNSRMRLPSASQVSEFPFIVMNNTTAPPQPLTTQLLALRSDSGGQSAWITMVPDNMWFIAGAGLKAFQTVDAQLLIALTLSDEPKFAVMAQATAVFPKSAGTPQEPFKGAFLVLDIVIYSEIDPLHGTIFAAGELTPRSFILSPSCALTGGFAFKLFLAGSEHEGDFVFTIGGYNKTISMPSHYPPGPQRVGIRWKYDDEIRVSGEAYFAITPQVAMGGARLDLFVDKSWVRVIFSAWADFFMHFHPFSYGVEVGITLSVEVNLPAWICNIHYGPSEFTARLGLHGPPLAGYVELRFWLWNIHIAFGPEIVRPPALPWSDFLRMVKNLPLHTQSSSDDIKAPNHMVSITRGTVPVHEHDHPEKKSENSADAIEIRGTYLEFQVQARVPVLEATVNATNVLAKDDSLSLFARPMQLQSTIPASHLKVSLKRMDGPGSEVSLRCQQIIRKKVAPALWGKYTNRSPSEVVSEPLLEYAMIFDLAVVPEPPPKENQLTVDIVKFNAVDLGPDGQGGTIPAVKEAPNAGKSVKVEGLNRMRGHAHLLATESLAKEGNEKAQWLRKAVLDLY